MTTEYKYKIVNENIEPFTGEVHHNKHNLPIESENYYGGGVEWSLIKWKKDAPARRKLDKYNWALDRLEWAKKECPKEIPELAGIIRNYLGN